MTIQEYIGKLFVGNTYHFKCDCLLKMDFIGTVVDYELDHTEIILLIRAENKKIVRLGTNHPNLTIEELKYD